MKLVKLVEALRAVSIEQIAPLGAALTLTGIFVHVVARRLTFPGELEWMTGSILDHIERVRLGLPVYTAPTVDWIPFMYPPLYYWIAAPVTAFIPGHLGARLISLASALIQAYCVWRLSLRHGATRVWALIGVGLFFAAFSYSGFWYDLERADSLFVALMAGGTVVLCESTGLAGALVAGSVVGLGFFAKQPAAVFAAAGVVALLLQGERPRAMAFGAAAWTIMIGGTIWLHVTTNGWFTYYVIWMPFAHGMFGEYAHLFFIQDLPRAFALTLATGALLAGLVRGDRRDAILACMVLAGLVASATSRFHPGGWDNVLMFWATLATAAVPVVCTRADEALATNRLARAGVALLVTAQFALWSYDPHAMHPHPWQQPYAEQFTDTIKQLEAAGEVLVPGRGHLTAARHFHVAALIDVVRTDGRLPDAIVRAFTERRFAALVVGSTEELRMPQFPSFDQQLFRVVVANYYVAVSLDDHPPPVAGFAGRSQLVLRPRVEVLDPADLMLLNRRNGLEILVVGDRLRAKMMKLAPPAEEASVEDLARDLTRRTMIGDVALSGGAAKPSR